MDSTDRLAEKMLREDRTLLDDAMRNSPRFINTRAGALLTQPVGPVASRGVAEDAVAMATRRILGGPPFG